MNNGDMARDIVTSLTKSQCHNITKDTTLLLAKKFIEQNCREDKGGHKAMIIYQIMEAYNCDKEVSHV